MKSSLHSKVKNGVLWSAIQHWSMRLSGLFLFIFMARLLTPTQLGLYAAATVVLAFIGMLSEQGLTEAVVQTSEISSKQLNCVFWLNVGLSIVMVVTLWFASPLVAAWLKLPELIDILRVSSIGIPITATTFGQVAMCKREFKYKFLAQVSLFSTLMAGIIALLMALNGFGVWSLVAQSLIFVIIMTLLLYRKPQWRLTKGLDFNGTKPLMTYGGHKLLSNILEFANTRYVEIFLAASVGPVGLAIYTVGSRVHQALMQTLSSAILDVAHNGFSRIAHDRNALINAYYKSVTLTATLAVPIFCLVGAAAPEFAVTLFGEKWAGSAEVMRFMSTLGVIQVIQFYNVTLYNSMGFPKIGMLLVAAKLFFTLIGFWYTRNSGLTSILIAFTFCQLLITPINFYLARRIVGISLRKLSSEIWPFFASSFSMMALVLLTSHLMNNLSINMIIKSTILTSVGLISYISITNILKPLALKNILDKI